MFMEWNLLLLGPPSIPGFTASISVHTSLHHCFFFSLSPFLSESKAPLVPSWCRSERRRGCFCACLHSRGNSITCTLLWNWNWHLASHRFYRAALMCFQKGRCVCLSVCVCVCVCALGLFIDVCWYLFDVCPALQGWKVNSLISPWTQLALWLAERRPGCAVFWRKEDLWNWGGSGGKESEAE